MMISVPGPLDVVQPPAWAKHFTHFENSLADRRDVSQVPTSSLVQPASQTNAGRVVFQAVHPVNEMLAFNNGQQVPSVTFWLQIAMWLLFDLRLAL